MNRNLYARKKRQLQNLAQILQQELGNTPKDFSEKAQLLIKKIKQLLSELSTAFRKHELNKMLAAVALIFGLSAFQEVKAQQFDSSVKSPFGLGVVDSNSVPAVADLDGDGDLDILLGEYYGTFQYFENIGTVNAPSFSSGQTNPFGLSIPSSVDAYLVAPAFADMDADGDLDILVGTGGTYNRDLVYFENTGSATQPQFASSQSNPFGISPPYQLDMPALADIDADGDLDLLLGTSGGNLVYYKNIGTSISAQFASPVFTPFGLPAGSGYAAAPNFIDLDGDGDFDLMVGDFGGNLNYFENTGSSTVPAFAAVQLNPFGLTATYDQSFPVSADVDNDGDMDVFVAEYGNELLYFQNKSINVGLTEKSLKTVSLYPNPSVDFIEVSSENNFSSYGIYNPSGILVQIGKYAGEQISVKELPAGFYSITLNSNKLAPVTLKFTKD